MQFLKDGVQTVVYFVGSQERDCCPFDLLDKLIKIHCTRHNHPIVLLQMGPTFETNPQVWHIFPCIGQYNSSTYTPNFKILAFFSVCEGWFVSDLVGNSEDQFSCVAAHLSVSSG